MDTTGLRNAYDALLDAATTVTGTRETAAPPVGEWNADQILAHIAIVDAGTIAAAYAVASGSQTVYDNRTWLDHWTIDRAISLAGGTGRLRERIRLQGEALCALGEEVLSDAELDTMIPARLLSAGTLLVDHAVPLRDLIAGIANDHLPRHTQQLLALLPTQATARH
jgi:hypothetical protein